MLTDTSFPNTLDWVVLDPLLTLSRAHCIPTSSGSELCAKKNLCQEQATETPFLLLRICHRAVGGQWYLREMTRSLLSLFSFLFFSLRPRRTLLTHLTSLIIWLQDHHLGLRMKTGVLLATFLGVAHVSVVAVVKWSVIFQRLSLSCPRVSLLTTEFSEMRRKASCLHAVRSRRAS